MAIHLPKGLRLPQNLHEVNASLLMTKYADIKTEKDESKTIIDRVCRGNSTEIKFRFSELPSTQTLVMKLMDRMIVDQSGGVMENSNLSLHPHFGTPVIPGSAVKGATRHYLWELWNEAKGAEKEVFQTELNEIFGDSSQSGKISFLMAIPYGSASIESDVLTCHHMDYYASKDTQKKATDDENPNPQFFPVVQKETSFEFVVKPTARGTDTLAEKALGYLKSALETNGIGAKTAAGYGWFEIDEEGNLSGEDRIHNDLLVADDFAKEIERILKDGKETEEHVLLAILLNEKADYWKKQLQNPTSSKAKKRIKKLQVLAEKHGETLS